MDFRNIEAERARLGMSGAALANAVGVSYGTYKNWKAGKTEITQSKLVLMAQLFHCSTDYLLGLTGQDNRGEAN